MGAPDFGSDISPSADILRFSPIAGAVSETQAVAKILGVNPVLGKEATETKLKNLVSPKLLHIATHGFFLEADAFRAQPTALRVRALAHLEEPLARSGLALAGANAWLQGQPTREDENDGLLTAEDILEMNLQGTELVVLSACDTGLGDVRPGQGVFGLRRTLAIAGAQTIIMSLWKVPDEQTRLLMEHFYQNLIGGYGRAESLRLAQQEIRRAFPDPHYWGAFVCLGDVGPLTITSPPTST